MYAQCSPKVGLPPPDSKFNTGSDGSNGVLNGGSSDLNWTFCTGNINGTYQPAIVMSSTPIVYYSSPWSNCTWISLSSSGKHTGSIDQYYKLNFNLPCLDLCGRSYDSAGTFCLTLDILVDNSIHEIYINGKAQGTRVSGTKVSNPYYHRGFEQSKMVSFSLCNDWKAGNNEFIIHIRSAEDYVGFLAQASVALQGQDRKVNVKDTIYRTICVGDSLKFGDSLYSKSGYYLAISKSNYGCDSFIALQLSVLNTIRTSINQSVCEGENNTNYTSSGLYIDTFMSRFGCDSIRTLDFTIIPRKTTTITRYTNDGFNHFGYTIPGLYRDTLNSFIGCDSIRVFNLVDCTLDSIRVLMPDTICSLNGPFQLESNKPNDSNVSWIGLYVSGDILDPNLAPDLNQFTSPIKIICNYINPNNQCKYKDSSLLWIEHSQEFDILIPNPINICKNDDVNLSVDVQFENDIKWSTIGDGSFENDINKITKYTPGDNDNNLNDYFIYVKSINYRYCPQAIDSVKVVIHEEPEFSLPIHMEDCAPARFNFRAIFKNYSNNYSLNWDFGNGQIINNTKDTLIANILYTNSIQAGYRVRVTAYNQWGNGIDDFCSFEVDSPAYVFVHSTPNAAFSSDPEYKTTIALTKFKFINQSSIQYGNMFYQWNFGDGSGTSNLRNPEYIYPEDTGLFRVFLRTYISYTYNSNTYFCSDSISKSIYIGPDITVFVPNVFSPESGIPSNNVFRPIINDADSFNMQIFNRWGELIFESNNPKVGWDGNYLGDKCQQDIYLYIIKVTAFDKKEYLFRGTLTMLR